MDSDIIILTEDDYWKRIVNGTELHKEFPLLKPFVYRNTDLHEHLGIEHKHDEYHKDHPNGRVFHFKIIDKPKYMLAKIKYGF
jgi:hypothetical protein